MTITLDSEKLRVILWPLYLPWKAVKSMLEWDWKIELDSSTITSLCAVAFFFSAMIALVSTVFFIGALVEGPAWLLWYIIPVIWLDVIGMYYLSRRL